MYAVHTTGSAVVGIFPRDIAETKSEQVNALRAGEPVSP